MASKTIENYKELTPTVHHHIDSAKNLPKAVKKVLADAYAVNTHKHRGPEYYAGLQEDVIKRPAMTGHRTARRKDNSRGFIIEDGLWDYEDLTKYEQHQYLNNGIIGDYTKLKVLKNLDVYKKCAGQLQFVDKLYCLQCSKDNNVVTHGINDEISCDAFYRIHDKPIAMGSNNRAFKTIPDELEIKQSNIPDAGNGVFAKEDIRANTFLGPYDGIRIPLHSNYPENSTYVWDLQQGLGRYPDQQFFSTLGVDGQHIVMSSWLRFVNTNKSKYLNLSAVQVNGDIFYVTTRLIKACEELFCSYGTKFDELILLKATTSRRKPKETPKESTNNLNILQKVTATTSSQKTKETPKKSTNERKCANGKKSCESKRQLEKTCKDLIYKTLSESGTLSEIDIPNEVNSLYQELMTYSENNNRKQVKSRNLLMHEDENISLTKSQQDIHVEMLGEFTDVNCYAYQWTKDPKNALKEIKCRHRARQAKMQAQTPTQTATDNQPQVHDTATLQQLVNVYQPTDQDRQPQPATQTATDTAAGSSNVYQPTNQDRNHQTAGSSCAARLQQATNVYHPTNQDIKHQNESQNATQTVKINRPQVAKKTGAPFSPRVRSECRTVKTTHATVVKVPMRPSK